MAKDNGLLVGVLGTALWACACGGGDDDDASGQDDPSSAACPLTVSDASCDASLRPIVFVHGTYGSGDNIAHVAQLFGSKLAMFQ